MISIVLYSWMRVAERYSNVYTYHIFLICSSADGHLGWFHLLAIMSGAATDMNVQISLHGGVWSSLGTCPGVEWLGHMVGSSIFNFFLSYLQTDFHIGCTKVHSRQQGIKVHSLSVSSLLFVARFLADSCLGWG